MFEQLPPQSRVWVYQSNRPFSDQEAEAIKEKAQQFAQRWVSHNQQLKAAGTLLHNRFLILMVDETQAGASGCSIDSSVAFVKQLQAEYSVDFFDRMRFSYQDEEGKVHTVAREDFEALYQKGTITDETKVFDTLVKNKQELEGAMVKPLKNSWHKRMV